MAKEFAKSHGKKAHDVISRSVISVEEDAELGGAAGIMQRNCIKRIPVIKDGKLVGMSHAAISFGRSAKSRRRRAKLILRIHSPSSHIEAFEEQSWLDTSYINMTVKTGIVRIWSYVQSEEHRNAIRTFIEDVPGVDRVDQNLEVGIPPSNWDGTLSRRSCDGDNDNGRSLNRISLLL